MANLINPLDLTPIEKLRKARVQIQKSNPFFAYLSLYLKFQEEDINNPLPADAGMGVDIEGNLYYKVKFVEKCTDAQLMGVLIHEILHLALLHLTRCGTRHPMGWNIAADICVNQIIKENNYSLPSGCLISDSNNSFKIFGQTIIDCNKKTVEIIYDELKIPKSSSICKCGKTNQQNQGQKGQQGGQQGKQNQKGKGDSGKCPNCGGYHQGFGYGDDSGFTPFDQHIQKTLEQLSPNDRKKVEDYWKQKTEEAYTSAKQRGMIPAGIDRLLESIHKEKVDWRSKLLKYIQRAIPYDYSYCLEKGTLVTTPRGNRKIETIRQGRYVLGYKNKKLVYSKVKSKIQNKVYEKFIIKTNLGKKIVCSENHRLLTERGYIKAKNLKKGDVVISI